ncbi:MAG: trigger factor [Chitinophagaceae bacterium]|nr:trigger factor [Chitinophagaceae bacterium]
MAHISRENLGVLHEKLSITLDVADYMPSFEKAVKQYSKNVNIPGFRKGMVPPSVVKKMYGNALLADEVLRCVDEQLTNYLQQQQVEIFAQPLPLQTQHFHPNVTRPSSYTFEFEIGLKPEFTLPDFKQIHLTKYEVDITEDMVEDYIREKRNELGKLNPVHAVETEENVISFSFITPQEADQGAGKKEFYSGFEKVSFFSDEFRKQLVGKEKDTEINTSLPQIFQGDNVESIKAEIEKNKTFPDVPESFIFRIVNVYEFVPAEVNEEFYKALFPKKKIETEDQLRENIREELQAFWQKATERKLENMLLDYLMEKVEMKFPEDFLKKWLKAERKKDDDSHEPDEEFQHFLNNLKWTLISNKIFNENQLQISIEEIRERIIRDVIRRTNFYPTDDNMMAMLNRYVDELMKNNKYVESIISELVGSKSLAWAVTQIHPEVKKVTRQEFLSLMKTKKAEEKV